MQMILKKMLLGTQFPMLDAPTRPEILTGIQGNLKDDAFVLTLTEEQQQAVESHKSALKRITALPKSRIELLVTLEEEIGLTGACLSSYICFKSEALQLIYAYNFGNVHEEEYLET